MSGVLVKSVIRELATDMDDTTVVDVDVDDVIDADIADATGMVSGCLKA